MAKLTYIKIFVDYLDALEPLGDAERGRLFTSLLTYARTGEAPQLNGNERFLFPLMRANIDRDISGMDEISAARSEAGKKGVEAKQANASKRKQIKQMPANEASASKSKQNEQTSANVSKTSKEKDKDKDEEKEDTLSPLPPLARETLRDWVAYKAERREPYKPRGLQSLVTQVSNSVAEYSEAAVVDVIRRSMAANYKGIVFDWLEKPKRAAQIVTKHGEMGDFEREAAMRMMGRSGMDDAR